MSHCHHNGITQFPRNKGTVTLSSTLYNSLTQGLTELGRKRKAGMP